MYVYIRVPAPGGRDFARCWAERGRPLDDDGARRTRERLARPSSRPGCVGTGRGAGSYDEFAQRCGYDRCSHVAASRGTRRPVARVLLAARVRAVPADAQVRPVQEPRCRVRAKGQSYYNSTYLTIIRYIYHTILIH